MIHFHQVSKRYPSGYEALNRLDFELQRGEMAFLTGHSGAGKSTVLKLITLLERASSGQIIVNGQNLSALGNRRIPYLRRSIGMVFQSHRLLNDHTVFDNVALPLMIAGLGAAEIGRRVRAALDKVGLLGKERLYPLVLSGGEQQRVGIALAVVNKPPLLLADEPTGNLDRQTASEVFALMLELNRGLGTSLVIATHDSEIAARAARILTLVDGVLQTA
jgi:cell division transport system ATP-binding protein